MPSLPSVIAAQQSKRQVLWLPDAIEKQWQLHRNRNVVLYCRASGYEQVRRGSLARQREEGQREIKKLGLRVAAVFAGEERGKLASRRYYIQLAVRAARRHNAMLNAADLSRWIRAEGFSTHSENWGTQATADEISRLFEEFEMDGLIVTTRQHPASTAADLHSVATRRGEAGRPQTALIGIDAFEVYEKKRNGWSFTALENYYKGLGYECSRGAIQRAIDKAKQRIETLGVLPIANVPG